MHEEEMEQEKMHEEEMEQMEVEEEQTAPPPASVDVDKRLAQQLVRYVATPQRILFCDVERTWREFARKPDAPEECCSAALCERFVREVLPSVADLPLDDLVRRHLEVLKLHPNFERCERGFRLKAPGERVGFKRLQAAVSNLGLVRPGRYMRLLTDEEVEEEFFTPPKRPRTEPVITELWTRKPGGQAHLPAVTAQFKLSPLFEAILSAAVSQESELANCLTFTNVELHHRMVVAKRHFEDRAWQLANIKDYEKLQDSLFGLMEMKRHITRLTSRYVSALWSAERGDQ